MRVYIGFDDTDHAGSERGTGKLARWFEKNLPEGCSLWGVVRQQLLVHQEIPFTSHNSSACAVVDAPAVDSLDILIKRAAEHIETYSLDGSDPGLCVTAAHDDAMGQLMAFGQECTRRIVTQKEAMKAAQGIHLSGHGGTDGGIIGAAAAVGLTAGGWSGRFIEFGKLRDLPDTVTVGELEGLNILVVSLDRDARVPAPRDPVVTRGWLRPRLWGQRAILPVRPNEDGTWQSLGEKRSKNGNGSH